MSKIALLPGGFKPPHAGHYNMAKALHANTTADKTIIFVGPGVRGGITQEMSFKLWKIYTQNDSELEVRISSISPVRDVYDFVEQEASEGSEVFLGIGAKDKTDKRYANIGKFAEPRNIKYKPVVVPPQAGGVSGTEMRGFIKMNDKPLFQYSLPEHLSDEQKEQAWSIVTGLDEDLNEGPQFGVLYHYVELRFLVGILNDNRLEGPVSLTRSKDSYVKVWKGKVPILILDKDKLRQNYKISPSRDIAAIDGTGDYSTGGGLGAAAGFYDDKSEKTKPFDEMEEVIENDIENIDKYIVKVILPSQYSEKTIKRLKLLLKEKGIPYEVEGLNEGKQVGKLYHYTDLFSIKNIIKQNELKASNDPPSISFTRVMNDDLEMWFGGGDNLIILVIDGDKLSQNYKIRPYRDWHPDMINPETGQEIDEYEERVDRDISNLDKYIIKVIIPNSFPEIESLLKEKNIPYEVTGLDEDLNEGPQFSVLYHYTDYLVEILNQNQLGQGQGDPISLTRSRDSDLKDWAMDAEGNKWAILILDKDKLRQNHKITPFKDPEYDGYSGDEMEEQIQPPITDLNKYLAKVILQEPRKEWEDYLEEKGIPYEVEGLDEDFYDPRNKYYDFAKSSEWKAGMPDGPKDDIPRHGDRIHNRQTAPVSWEESVKSETGKILHAYDFDDTIAQVQANIKVFITSPSGDYNKEILIPASNFPEESKELEARLGSLEIKYDFSEFEKQIGDAIVNSKVVSKLKDSLSRPEVKTTILTARSIGHPVTRYMREELGLAAYVVPLGLQVDGKVTGQDKADWIENHINKGYKTVYFIDDSEENRTAVAALKDKHPDVNLTVEDPAAVNEMMGMMNKQEKAKHAKNIKRLSKDMSNMKGDNYGGGGYKVPNYVKGTLTRKLYETKDPMIKTAVFSQNWWKEQITEVLTETKANTHLTHLEELVLTQGQDGYNQARSFLFELIKNLRGEDSSIKNVSVKWDGAPAVWAGINPENGKFFVGIKGIFNTVTPKINYTPQDIDKNHGHSGDLVKKLKLALQYLPALGIKNILQGDFMFDGDDVETKNIDGVPHYTFRPNTITYAVEANSKIGKQIIAARIGVIWHTTYNSLEERDFKYGADVSGLSQTSNVWFDDAYFKDDTGVLLSSKEEDFVLEKIKEADSINVDYDALPDEISSRAKTNMLNTYLNSEVRIGEFINDPNKSFERFKNWYQLAVDKSIEKVKRPESKERKKLAGEEKLKIFDSKKDIVLNLFKVSKLLSEAKSIFITKYDKAVATKHFIDNGDGTLSVTKAEGFVAVDHSENGIKLVDRLEFSKNNFNAGKPGAKK